MYRRPSICQVSWAGVQRAHAGTLKGADQVTAQLALALRSRARASPTSPPVSVLRLGRCRDLAGVPISDDLVGALVCRAVAGHGDEERLPFDPGEASRGERRNVGRPVPPA